MKNPEAEKMRLVEYVAQLIKNDIKSCSSSNGLYSSSEEISCLEHAVSFLPESLMLLLELMFVQHDK